MTIAEVSKKYDLPTDTLRYYEKVGLIPYVNRTSGGIRNYCEEDCRWVEFIKCMRSAGLEIEVLAKYLSLFQQGDVTLGQRKDLLIKQRDQLASKVNAMQATLDKLNHKIEYYEHNIFDFESKLKK